MDKSKRREQTTSRGATTDLPLRRLPPPATTSSTSSLARADASSSDHPLPTPHTNLHKTTSSESARPGTPSSSSQSGIAGAWDPVSHRAGPDSTADDRSSSATSDFWPRSDSDDYDSYGGAGGALKKSVTKSSGSSTTRFFRAILQKFGRSYNKRGLFFPGYDFLPNDKQEQDRNVLQHEIFMDVLDGRTHLAPTVNPRRVLDLGTGPGNWPLEFAKRNPHCAVLGIDLEPVNPAYTLPNCYFQVRDFADVWEYDQRFDLVHCRMLGSMPSEGVFNSIYENLDPGGWAEFTEWIVIVQTPDRSHEGSAFIKWNSMMRQGLRKIGKTVSYPLGYKTALLKAGFVNVTERKHAVPINPWPPGKSLQRIGTRMTSNFLMIIDALSLPLFTKVLGWSPEALESLLVDVRNDVEDTRIHAFLNLMTVYCQKPREQPSSTASAQSTATQH